MLVDRDEALFLRPYRFLDGSYGNHRLALVARKAQSCFHAQPGLPVDREHGRFAAIVGVLPFMWRAC